MNTIKKFFLLTVLGMGVYVQETNASSVSSKIRATIQHHSAAFDAIKNSNQLNHALAQIKQEVLAILNSEETLSDREKDLKIALEKLNPADKFSVASQIKPILDNLEPDVAHKIKAAIPPVYRAILGL